MNEYIKIIIYGIIGAGLKYVDEIYDTRSFKPRNVYFISLGIGLLMGTIMALDINSFIILTSVIISVGVTGKIDNEAFKLIAAVALTVPLIFLFFNLDTYIFLLPLLVLTLAGVCDEYLDEIGDKKNSTLLTLRPFMKVAIIVLWFVGIFEIVYVFSFFSFDIFYSLVGWYSNKIIELGGKDEKDKL